MNKRLVAFIPARGGSKGIPMKNIRPFCGRPLIYWVVKAAQELQEIDAVFISTDDPSIKTTVQGFGFSKVVVVDRSPATATDEASTESAMLEFAENYDFEDVVLIQPTSPLTETADLAGAVRVYREKSADSLLSGVWQKRFHWKVDGKFAMPENYLPSKRPRRQDWQGTFVENGAIYITKRSLLLQSGCRLSGNIAYYAMPEHTYWEIDQPEDWPAAEYLKKMYGRFGFTDDLFERINLLVCDVDGVLTDAGLYYQDGAENRKFNTRDGMGIALVKKAGVKVMFLTSEETQGIAQRAAKLNVDYLHMGIKNKKEFLDDFYSKHAEFDFSNTAYIGDDINDLSNIQTAGFSAAPQDALNIVKQAAKYICGYPGGQGCVREVCDMIVARRRHAD